MQRHPTLTVELRTAHFRATEPARALHPDALDAWALEGGLHALAHRPPEAHPVGQLLGNTLRDQLGVSLGVLHLKDVELNLLAGELLQLAPDPVRLGAAATDHDARTGGVDVHPNPVPGALDLNLGDAGPLHALGHQATDGDVFLDVLGVVLVGEPAALPVGGDTEAEPVRVYFLPH